MLEPMTAFVEAHPCEVWDKEGNFHSRYASMVCAARTVLQLGGGSVVDASPGNLEGTWDLGDCKKNVAASSWVFGSRKYEPRYAN